MIIFPPQTKFIGLIVIAGEGYVRWDSTYSRYTLRPVSPKPNNPEPHSHIYTYIYPWHLASVPVFCSYLPYTYTAQLLPDLFFLYSWDMELKLNSFGIWHKKIEVKFYTSDFNTIGTFCFSWSAPVMFDKRHRICKQRNLSRMLYQFSKSWKQSEF